MKNFNTLRRTLLVSALVLTFGSCQDDFTAPAGLNGKSIAATMAADPNFNIWTAVVTKAGLYNSLNNNNSGVVTIFAPSDPAMVIYLSGVFSSQLTPPISETSILAFLDQLTTTSNPTLAAFSAALVPVINYHIVSSKITSNMLTGNQVFATLNNARLSISKVGTTVMLNANVATNGATVTAFDLQGSNGVAHTIDRVMTALSTANVLTNMGVSVAYTTNPPTVASPAFDGTDSDFDLLANLIRYTGQAPTILPNTTPLPDFTIFQANDGLMRAYLTAVFPASGNTTEVQWGAYIVSLTSATPPPTPSPTLAELTALTQYHVVPGRFLTTDLTTGQVLTTLLTGKSITVTINPVPPAAGPYTFTLGDLNAAADPTISAPNTQTNSGIIHTINAVLRNN